MSKGKFGFSKIIVNTILAMISLFGFFNKLSQLLELEAQLAGRGLINILILCFVIASLLISVWLSVLGLLFIYFTSLQWSLSFSLSLILLLNVLVLIISVFVLSKIKHQLIFPATRQLLKRYKSKIHDEY